MMSIPFHRENTSIFWVVFFFFWLVCFVVIFLWSWREPTFRFEMSEWYRLPCIINLSDSSSCRMHSFRSQVLLLDLLSYMLVYIYIFRNLKLWKNISRYRPHGISILWKQVIDLELFYYYFFKFRHLRILCRFQKLL